jgi:small subunit ribosomal protein S24e
MLFGFRTVFGGGKSTGFALVYDSVDALMKFERKYRQARFGLIEHKRMARKRIKETKNRCKKFRGKKKAEVFASAKK